MKAREIIINTSRDMADAIERGGKEGSKEWAEAIDTALLALKEMVLNKKKGFSCEFDDRLDIGQEEKDKRRGWNQAIDEVARLFEEEKNG